MKVERLIWTKVVLWEDPSHEQGYQPEQQLDSAGKRVVWPWKESDDLKYIT
jgi:hypothetical protein